VVIDVDDHVAPLTEGGVFFIGRSLEARVTGRPDLTRSAV
jgi:hypothetical protein